MKKSARSTPCPGMWIMITYQLFSRNPEYFRLAAWLRLRRRQLLAPVNNAANVVSSGDVRRRLRVLTRDENYYDWLRRKFDEKRHSFKTPCAISALIFTPGLAFYPGHAFRRNWRRLKFNEMMESGVAGVPGEAAHENVNQTQDCHGRWRTG